MKFGKHWGIDINGRDQGEGVEEKVKGIYKGKEQTRRE